MRALELEPDRRCRAARAMRDAADAYQGGRPAEAEDDVWSLTERERQILDHLSRGESNKTIARALDISHDTVKLHVRHILSKLGLSSRVEAAVFAVEFRGTPAGAAQAGEPARKPAR